MSRIDRPPFAWQSGKLYRSNDVAVNAADAYDAFTNLKTVEYTPIVESKPLPYADFVRNKLIPNTPSNISVVSGELRVDGSVTKQAIYTRKYGRYLPGLIGLLGIGVRLETPNVGQYEFGYGNETTRLGLEIDNGDWYFFIESDGNRYKRIPRTQWDDKLDGTGPSGINVDDIVTSKMILRVYIGWYGYLPIEFRLIFAGQEIIVHSIYNDTDGASISQPDLPVFAQANGGVMYIGGRHYGVYGRYNPEKRITSLPSVTKTVGNTDWEPVVSIRIKSGTQLEGVPVMLSSMTSFNDTDAEYVFFLHDASLLTGASFVTIPDTTADGSSLEYDESSTSLATGGYNMYSDIMKGGDRNTIASNPENFPDIDVTPDLVVTLAVRSLATSTVITSKVRFKEIW